MQAQDDHVLHTVGLAGLDGLKDARVDLLAADNFASPLGDFNGHGDGYVCLSRTRHLSAGEKAFESHYDPFPLYPYRSRGNKKCKRQIATGTEACPGSHRF